MAAVKKGKHVDFSSPRGYYLDHSDLADVVPSAGAGGRNVSAAGEVSPSLLARAALGNLEIYLGGGNASRRDAFEALSRRLVDTQEVVPGSYGGWAMPEVPRALRGVLKPGWFSGSTHAECVSTLVRAAALLRLDGALEAARRAFGAFSTDVADGGFMREIGDEGHEGVLESLAFIEEHTLPDRPGLDMGTHVLALWAIFDYHAVTGDHGAERLLRRCLDGLRFLLEGYDLGYWTRADLDPSRRHPRPSTSEDLGAQALMLEVLADMTGDATFADAARRWRAYAGRRGGAARARLGRAWSGLANSVDPSTRGR